MKTEYCCGVEISKIFKIELLEFVNGVDLRHLVSGREIFLVIPVGFKENLKVLLTHCTETLHGTSLGLGLRCQVSCTIVYQQMYLRPSETILDCFAAEHVLSVRLKIFWLIISLTNAIN